jgi:hypothetical protein
MKIFAVEMAAIMLINSGQYAAILAGITVKQQI